MKSIIRGFICAAAAVATYAQAGGAPANVYDLSSFGIPPATNQKTYTGTYDAPTPQLGCKVFDVRGRALDDGELTDKQRYQVANCIRSADLMRDRAALSAQIQDRLDAISEENHRRTAALANMPAAPGTPGPIAYPLPANTPTIILQTQ
ncbi:hypothetical protein [Burkholderia multivorans]|uniref:hypothetical protein n=1 Tax=Burkholderia multivorans TaxID=87883 RepID=UPI0021C1F57C|nr:hypothetical protein [Burkholderia multivorans]